MKKSRYFLGLIALALLCPLSSAQAESSFRALPEMSEPSDYVIFKRGERAALEKNPESLRVLDAAEAHARSLWPRLRTELDLVSMSRWHVEETRGFELPENPIFESRVLGRDDTGGWHVDLRGPRLPARYDIVHRHLHVLAVVHEDGRVEHVSATIRMRIYE